jgi:hypothetical protein
VVQQEALEHYLKLKIHVLQATQDTFTKSKEEFALINIPKGNIIPTFLIVAAEETEPFKPKTL